MTRLETTTLQEVRRFLTALEVPPSPYADAGEVLALLTQSVRRRRNDPALRAELSKLIDQLQTRAPLGADTVHVPDLETVDPSSLARELQTLASTPATSPFRHKRRLAAAMLLASLMVGVLLLPACGSNDNNSGDPDCLNNVSLAHFQNLINHADGGLNEAQRQEAVVEYQSLRPERQVGVIHELCDMPAEDIVAYLESGCADAPDFGYDDGALYKGVDFG